MTGHSRKQWDNSRQTEKTLFWCLNINTNAQHTYQNTAKKTQNDAKILINQTKSLDARQLEPSPISCYHFFFFFENHVLSGISCWQKIDPTHSHKEQPCLILDYITASIILLRQSHVKLTYFHTSFPRSPDSI